MLQRGGLILQLLLRLLIHFCDLGRVRLKGVGVLKEAVLVIVRMLSKSGSSSMLQPWSHSNVHMSCAHDG